MKHTPIPTNFVYPEIKPETFKFGSGQLAGVPLREDGDWRDFLPPEEDQNIRGIESSACYIEASQHAIATIEEEQLGEPDNNYSARFNALLSGGTKTGGDPLKGGDSIRHDGLVKDSSMPFGDEIYSWEDFHSFKGVDETAVRAEGKKYLEKKKLGYDVVVERHYPVATKYLKLKESLKYSPCPVSVVAWYEKDGVYYKPEGLRDTHLVELVYIDENNHPYIRDTYAPYMKKLEANFNFDFGMRWSVEKKTEAEQATLTVFETLMKYGLLAFFARFVELFNAPVAPKTVPISVITPTPMPEPTAERLAQEAELWLGIDPTPDDKISDDVACVSSLVKVIWPVIKLDLNLSYTPLLEKAIRDSGKFKATLTPKRGNIIISATKGSTVGHCGVMLSDTRIASNNSFGGIKGRWSDNYAFKNWVSAFKTKKGLAVNMYEAI